MYVCMFIVFARIFVLNKSKNFNELLPEIYNNIRYLCKVKIIIAKYIQCRAHNTTYMQYKQIGIHIFLSIFKLQIPTNIGLFILSEIYEHDIQNSKLWMYADNV